MKTLILKPEHNITEFCGNDPSKPMLWGLLYDKSKSRIVATDGCRLIMVPTVEVEINSQNLPAETAVITRSAMEMVFKQNYPMDRIVVTVTKPDEIHFTTTKADITQDISTCPILTKYLDVEWVLNSVPTRPANAKVWIDASFLKSFCDYAENFGECVINMEIWGERDPIRFTIKTKVGDVIGLLMPLAKDMQPVI